MRAKKCWCENVDMSVKNDAVSCSQVDMSTLWNGIYKCQLQLRGNDTPNSEK